MIPKVTALLAAGMLLGTMLCSEQSSVGKGGSSETVNAQIIIADTVLYAGRVDASGHALELQSFSLQYRPYERAGYAGTPVKSTVGSVVWKAPAAGGYNVLLIAPNEQTSCLIENVTLGQGIADTILCSLGQQHTLRGVLEPSDTSTAAGEYLLSIYGSPFYALTDSNRRFLIPEVPDGRFTLRVRSTEKRLFITTSEYVVATGTFESSTRLRVVIP